MQISYFAGATVREYAEASAHTLDYGALLDHLEDGTVRVSIGTSLGRDGEFAEDTWTEHRGSAAVESLAAERLIDEATAELARRLPEWLDRLAAKIE